MHEIIRVAGVLGLALLIAQPASFGAVKPASERSRPAPGRLIIKFQGTPHKRTAAAMNPHRVTTLALATSVAMRATRALSGGAQLVHVKRPMPAAKLAAMAARLSRQPGVAYAEPDIRLYPALLPNDPRYVKQLYLKGPAVQPGAINMPAAWNTTTGSASTVTAVIDSGLLFDHVDIRGKALRGYDFISEDPNKSFFTANDGNGRDNNAADPGDACSATGRPSTWHGTRVASLIGAVTNDGQGMAGIDWSARILPVRAVGRCGGFVSDIIDAIRWAAGLPVPGVPDNPHPAQIINLSVTAPTTCMAAQQDAINDAIEAGALVVAAAGNASTNALRANPSSCQGVLPVAATTQGGGLAGFSNFGVKVGMSAPGVDLLTAANQGKNAPVSNGDTHTTITGTSFSAPLAAGVAALMLGLNPDLTPAQLIATMRANARAFPPVSNAERCVDPRCGAGLLDAAGAIEAVARGDIATVADGNNGLRAALRSATPLTFGGAHAGALTRHFQFDVYKLSLPPGSHLTARTISNIDTYGYLFDARGRLLAQQDDIDPDAGFGDTRVNLNFGIDEQLPQGTYYVAVEGFRSNTVGNYRLTTNLLAPNTGGDAGGGGAAFGLLGIIFSAYLFRAFAPRARASR
jgi:serine protease